jgi:Leucine-rich repeat (LRR) protein
MKKESLKKSVIIAAVALLGFSNMANAQNVNIPDAIFKAALVGNSAINTNGDGEIQVTEAEVYSGGISVVDMEITDLTGIEAFTSLTSLNCSLNYLTSLSVSANTSLVFLDCSSSPLLTSLDVSSNIALSELKCSGSPLESLDVSGCTALTKLICNNSQLSNLNVNNCTLLSDLQCSNNSLLNLDVSTNIALTSLLCEGNTLISLDVSDNTSLVILNCIQNPSLSRLNVKNGNNTNFELFYAFLNPNLTCIEVDDAEWSTINWLYIDEIAFFSEECILPPVVSIPDANFKAALVNDLSINTNGDNDIQVSEAEAYTGGLEINNLNISNLTGIEAFTNLPSLVCSYNQLTNLDVSANMALIELYCENNQLTSLNVQNGNNINFTSFNASNNPDLACIQVDNAAWSITNWTDIDEGASFSEDCSCTVNIPDAIFKNYLLNNESINLNGDDLIHCYEAKAFTGEINLFNLAVADLTGLEVFKSITSFECVGEYQLTSLDVSANKALTNLGAHFTNISSLNVSENTALTSLTCIWSNLTSLDVSNNTALTNLQCGWNHLTELDVSTNTNLKYLMCSVNPLTSLNVSSNTALEYLLCIANQFNSLDVSANAALKELECDLNKLTYLDISLNPNLKKLKCNDNLLMSLNVQNGNNSNFTTFSAINNPNLTCIQVDDADWSNTNWTNIDPVASFSENCAVGIDNNLITAEVAIYPNPNSGTFTVFSSEALNAQLTCTNVLGEIVYTSTVTNEKTSVDISNQPKGMYFYTVQAGKNVLATGKVIVE